METIEARATFNQIAADARKAVDMTDVKKASYASKLKGTQESD